MTAKVLGWRAQPGPTRAADAAAPLGALRLRRRRAPGRRAGAGARRDLRRTLVIETFEPVPERDPDALVEEGAGLLAIVSADADAHDVRFECPF